MIRSFSSLSFAKLNLYLKVRQLRDDGYHNLDTLFQEVNLFDNLFFHIEEDYLSRIDVHSPSIPGSVQDNIVYKSVLLFLKTFSMNFSVKVFIDKHIPLGAGLGGGSSNAATTLSVLGRYKGIGRETLLPLAKKLGADVPFFLYGGLAFATGRGDNIQAINNFQYKKKFLIVVPKIHVSTAHVFKKLRVFRESRFEKLTKNFSYDRNIAHFLKKIAKDKQIFLGNDLESFVCSLYPEVGNVKEILERKLKKTLQMTGSGTSFFLECPDDKKEKSKVQMLINQLGCNVFISTAVFRSS